MTDDLRRRSDEDMPPAEFAAEEARGDDGLGNWPEIAGAALTALLLWLSFAFTG